MGKVQMAAKKKTTTKKAADIASAGSMIPSASELGDPIVGAPGGGTGSATAGVDGETTLHIFEMDYCNDGSVYGMQFEGKLKALHCIYNTFPSILYSCVASMQKYAQELHEADNEQPKDMKALEEQFGMKLIATTEKDLDKVKTFKKNRVVFYVDAANVKALSCYLDGWVAWRLQNPISPNDPKTADSVNIVFHVPLNSSRVPAWGRNGKSVYYREGEV